MFLPFFTLNTLKTSNMKTLFETLVCIGYTEEEADVIIFDMRNAVLNGDDPEELLYEFGLEPDYVMDILTY